MKPVTLEEVKKMSDEELRIEVALIAGFQPHCEDRFCMWKGQDAHGQLFQIIPDYPHDLNAVHEVGKNLPANQRDMFIIHLAQITKVAYLAGITGSTITAWKFAHATARQRCEALVLCLSPDVKSSHV